MRTLVPLAVYVVSNPEELGVASQEFARSILIDITDNNTLLRDYTLYRPRPDIHYPALIAFSGNRGDDYIQLAHVPVESLQEG